MEEKKIRLILEGGGEIKTKTSMDLTLLEMIIKHNPDIKYYIVQKTK